MADISIADFWGGENIAPELDDDRGTSLVLIHTDIGMTIFERIKELAVFKSVDFKKAIESNPAYYKSAIKPKDRDVFFKELNACGYKTVARKYGHLTKKELLIKTLRKTPVLKMYQKIIRYKKKISVVK